MQEQVHLKGLPSEYADTRPSRNQILDDDRPIHDWYRFVLSFPPHLVREYLERFEADDDMVVLDPFCGTGTTLVEAKKRGLASIGIEAVPLSAFAAKTKVDWSIDPDQLESDAQIVSDRATERSHVERDEPLQCLSPEQSKLLLRNSISPLPLHRAMLLIDAIDSLGGPCAPYLRLAVARELPTRIGNLRFGPEIGLGEIKEDAPVVDIWFEQVRRMADHLRAWQSRAAVPSQVVHGDARTPDSLLEPHSVDLVITSPPYPNEKDYTRTVRLESVLLGFLRDRESLRAVKKGLVRSNTRSVYKQDDDDSWLEQFPMVGELADRIEARRLELGKTSGFERMYHRVTRLYFGGMAKHLASLSNALRPGARLAYVVGDQASYFRVMIHTGRLLAEIAEHLGYEVEDIDLFRTRAATATRAQINEEVLVLKWPE
ncbi:MAG: DNA methyltransferase [Chloroflexota bacterium]|nr:DNA methyltransferase [Chloroflexota bacterium]